MEIWTSDPTNSASYQLGPFLPTRPGSEVGRTRKKKIVLYFTTSLLYVYYLLQRHCNCDKNCGKYLDVRKNPLAQDIKRYGTAIHS